VAEGVSTGFFLGHERGINITGSVPAVSQVTLPLQDSYQRPDRRITGGIRQALKDLKNRRLLQLVDDVHDLAFPPAQASVIRHAGLPVLSARYANILAC